MHTDRRRSSYSVRELASDSTSKSSRHSLYQAQQPQQRASYLERGSCYRIADLGLVDGGRGEPDIRSSRAQGLSPAWAPLTDGLCHRVSGPRARRPGSVDTDSSSADSGIQSAGPSQYAGGDLNAVKPRQEYYNEVCRVVYEFAEQRMPIVQDGYVARGGCSSNEAPLSGRVIVDGRLRGPDRGLESPLARNAHPESGSVGHLSSGGHHGVNGYGLMCGSSNGLTGQHNGFLLHQQVHKGPLRVAIRNGPAMDKREGVAMVRSCPQQEQQIREDYKGPLRVAIRNGPAMDKREGVAMARSCPQQEQQIREDYLRRRSNSNDSGYHDRNAEALERALHPLGQSDRCLEAHQLSLSAPSTPIHSNPKKSSTPSMIKRQLKTISEAMAPLRKPKPAREKSTRNGNRDLESSTQEINVCASSDVSDDDEKMENKKNSKDSNKSQAQPLNQSPTPPLLNSSTADVRRSVASGLSSVGTADSSASARKPKPLASRSRFWSKKFGELKSAPSSPELSRKNRITQGLSMDGHITVKTPTNILELTDGERVALQKIAVQRLQQIGLGPISVPKSGYERRKTLKDIFQLKRHGTNNGAQTASSDATPKGGGSGVAMGEPEKEKSSTRSRRWTFGIPLERCINNDVILGRVTLQPPGGARASSSDEGVAEGGRLLDALSLSVNHGLRGVAGGAWVPDGQTLQVPYVVRTCCSHLREHALRVKGLFRIGGLKSRVIQLKQEFDSGAMVQLTADHSPHDVASLLKEFLRELPQCLLTRDLYQAFVTTASLKNADERLMALRFLVALLPVANRDTLWMLLSLLRAVVENSSDQVTRSGTQLSGNCMDSSNLATLFGPNILHKFKPGKSHLDSMDQLNQHVDITAVVKEMINSFEAIFKLPEDIHQEILHALMERNPEAAEYILCHQGNGACPKVPSDSSLRLLDDSRDNSFLTNSICSTVSSDTPTDQSRPRDPVQTITMVQHPPSHEKQNHPKSRTDLKHSLSSPFFQRTDGISVTRVNEDFQNSPQAGNGLNSPDFDPSILRRGQGFTSTPKSESNPNSDVNRLHYSLPNNVLNSSQLSLSLATHKRETENASQIVTARRFGPSPVGQPEMESQLNVSPGAGSWEQQRWKYWEELAKKLSEELQEQQTLV